MTYLDTHVAVWLYNGETDRFPSEARSLLEAGDLTLSPAAVLEMQYLYEAGRILVKAPQIVEYLQSMLDVRVSGMRFDRVVVEAIEQEWTRDPFDRLIAAQAKVSDAPLVTKDGIIHENYEKAIW